MSFLIVNGQPALEASIAMPLVGVPTFTLAMLEQDLPAGDALQVQVGELVWQATVRRKGTNAGRGLVHAVGGAGGMNLELEPRSYLAVPLRIPLADLVADAGERLAGTSDAAILSTDLPAWTRTRESASRALGSLLAAAGSPSWRILPDGTLWVGPETWPESRIEEWTITADHAHNAVLELHSLAPAVFPGETFDGRRVVRVEHHISARRMLTRVQVEDAAGASAPDRVWAAFERLVRRVFSRIDYLATYPARVVGQNEDLTLELAPDDDRLLPSYSRVPIRCGVPGTTARVPAGARVLLGFAAGDPRKPQAELWESAAPTEIVLGTGANQPAALATALRTELDAIWDAIYGHAHPYTWTGSAGAGTTSAAPGSAAKQTIASSVVKVRV